MVAFILVNIGPNNGLPDKRLAAIGTIDAILTNRTIRNKFQLHIYMYTRIFFQEIGFLSVICKISGIF